MTNKERKTKIENRLQELEELRIQRDSIDERLLLAEGSEYYNVVAEACDIRKKMNIIEGGIKKMIKRLMNDIYGSWSWLDESDFCEFKQTFKKFAY